MARVPIVHVDTILIVTFLEDLHDRDTVRLQEEIGIALERTDATGVLLDLTLLEMVDSFLGRMVTEVAAHAKLLGASAVVVGIQPAVAVTLVELGLHLDGVLTALTAERGMKLLRNVRSRESRQFSVH